MSETLDDNLLLFQMQQGNKDAFNHLFNKYWPQAYAGAFRRLKDVDQAKDVVQEVFVNVWLKRETPIHNFPAYLNIAVRNQVFKQAIKQKRNSPFLDIFHDLPAENQQPDANIRWNEFNVAYEALVTTLPPKRQRIFRLRFNEDMTTSAIAAEMGITRKTVQNQLGKAVEHLRAFLLSSSIILFFACLYHL
jgi:RNA polymerase sigma-70 factor (family 1)